jgi:large subunit ribosomal protein L35
MPKLKTHKGARKRFKITGKKKVIYSKAFKNHILTKKSAKRKRSLSKPGEISRADRSRIKSMLPYDF